MGTTQSYAVVCEAIDGYYRVVRGELRTNADVTHETVRNDLENFEDVLERVRNLIEENPDPHDEELMREEERAFEEWLGEGRNATRAMFTRAMVAAATGAEHDESDSASTAREAIGAGLTLGDVRNAWNEQVCVATRYRGGEDGYRQWSELVGKGESILDEERRIAAREGQEHAGRLATLEALANAIAEPGTGPATRATLVEEIVLTARGAIGTEGGE